MSHFSRIQLDFYDNPMMIKDFGEVPAFVKSACPIPRSTLEKKGSAAYSLVIMSPDGGIYPKYPINDPANTWISLKAFEKTAYKLPVRMQETAACYLVDAAESWGIDDIHPKTKKLAEQNTNPSNTVAAHDSDEAPIESVKEATARHESFKEKLSGEWFALVEDEDGNEIKKFPLYNEYQTKQADGWFQENYQSLRPMLRKQYVDNLIKAANRHKIALASDKIFKYASQDFSPGVEVAIQVRKALTVDEDNLHLLDDLLNKRAELTPHQFAKGLEKIDEFLSIKPYWDRDIPDPYESVFSMPKQADYSFSDGDSEVSGEELRDYIKNKKFRSTLESYISKEIIDELERNPIEVFDSLPKPEKKLILDLMQDV